jgi:hypothetical protein
MVVSGAGIAGAQTTPSSGETLEQEFTDPLATLPQLIIRDSYSPATYGTNVQTNQVIIRPIIPRVPPNTLLPFTQLVRPTFALVTVPSPRSGSRSEFGDLPLFDLAVLPWPDRKKPGLLIGIGPTFVFPTATSRSGGQGAWQAGPAFGAVYTRIPGTLLKGNGFHVDEEVPTDGLTAHFTLRSDVGTFKADGLEMLRIRVRDPGNRGTDADQ